jgi:hypothetical protein
MHKATQKVSPLQKRLGIIATGVHLLVMEAEKENCAVRDS